MHCLNCGQIGHFKGSQPLTCFWSCLNQSWPLFAIRFNPNTGNKGIRLSYLDSGSFDSGVLFGKFITAILTFVRYVCKKEQSLDNNFRYPPLGCSPLGCHGNTLKMFSPDIINRGVNKHVLLVH